MIKFFRRIRQKLLTENKFSKYLLYAVGEIILVVIGILIALQINTWNQAYLEAKEEGLLLNAIAETITFNRFQYQMGLERHEGVVQSSLELLELRDKPYQDSLNTIIERHLFRIKRRFLMGKSNETSIYDELSASGKINLLKSRLLRSELTKFKSNLQLLASYEEQQINFVDNHLTPFLSTTIDFIAINNNAQLNDSLDEKVHLGMLPKIGGTQDYSALLKDRTFANLLIELANQTKTFLPIYVRMDKNIKVIDSISNIPNSSN